MFKEIEKIYKEQSEYNIMIKVLFIAYCGIIGALMIFDIKISAWILFAITLILTLMLLIFVVYRLNLKITFNKKIETHDLAYFFYQQEYELMKEYILSKNMMNVEILKNIINHYRNKIPINIKSDKFMTILSLFITIIFSVVDKDGIKINFLNRTLPFIFIFLIVYGSYQMINHLTKTIKGEVGIYERLEEIFSDILIEASEQNFCYNRVDNTRTSEKDDGSCQYYIYGCTDENTSNYNAKADKDDGSCELLATTDESKKDNKVDSEEESDGLSTLVGVDAIAGGAYLYKKKKKK